MATPKIPAQKDFSAHFKAVTGMGRLRFELRTNRLKAECSTAELATRRLGLAPGQPFRAPSERITQPGSPPSAIGPPAGGGTEHTGPNCP